MNCLNCGKELTGRAAKYCGARCQVDYQHNQWVQRWKNGEETGLKGKYQVSNHLRRYSKEKYNNQSRRWGWSKINPYTGEFPLEVEHIDGN